MWIDFPVIFLVSYFGTVELSHLIFTKYKHTHTRNIWNVKHDSKIETISFNPNGANQLIKVGVLLLFENNIFLFPRFLFIVLFWSLSKITHSSSSHNTSNAQKYPKHCNFYQEHIFIDLAIFFFIYINVSSLFVLFILFWNSLPEFGR